MVKRIEKKNTIALLTALLLAFAMVTSLIPAIKSEAATGTEVKGTIGVTIPPVGTTLNISTFDNYISSESNPPTDDVYIVAANRPPSLDEVNDWLLSGGASTTNYQKPDWGYDWDYSTTVEAGNDYYFVYIFTEGSAFSDSSTVTVTGASDQKFLGVKNNTTPTGEIGVMTGWVKVSIPENTTPTNTDTSSTPASTNTSTQTASNQATSSADTTTTNTTIRATAPKTQDTLPIVPIVSIIGAGALTSVAIVVSRKRH